MKEYVDRMKAVDDAAGFWKEDGTFSTVGADDRVLTIYTEFLNERAEHAALQSKVSEMKSRIIELQKEVSKLKRSRK